MLRMHKDRGKKMNGNGRFRVAIVDSDHEWSDKLESVIAERVSSHGVDVELFTYPLDAGDLLQMASLFDLVLIEENLGVVSGAMVARSILSEGFSGQILIVSDHVDVRYKAFSTYKSKDELINNPEEIFGNSQDIVKQAVETSVLLMKG